MVHGTIDGYFNHCCRCGECLAAANAYQRKRLDDRRDAYFADKCCVRCGSREKLHNHHRDPATKGENFNTVWGWSAKRREAELALCDVLCASCHSKHHNHERMKPIVHGTLHAYSKRLCRCDECRAAWSTYQRAYQERRRAEGTRPSTPVEHGTRNGYTNHGCRCDECVAEHRRYHREYQRRKRAEQRAAATR